MFSMRPEPDDYSIRIPITFDYKGGRGENKRNKILLTIVVSIIAIILMVGIALNDDNEICNEVKNLPNNCGGIYLFFIQGASLPFCERYLVYVGRAQYTQTESLRSRVKSYLPESRKQSGRTRIVRLFKYWKEHLYIRYYQSKDNEFIKQCESALIHAILPPFNTDLTEYKIKEPIKAF